MRVGCVDVESEWKSGGGGGAYGELSVGVRV